MTRAEVRAYVRAQLAGFEERQAQRTAERQARNAEIAAARASRSKRTRRSPPRPAMSRMSVNTSQRQAMSPAFVDVRSPFRP